MGKREKWLRHVRSFMKAGRPNSIETSQSRFMIEPAAQQNSEDEQILMNEKKGSLENGEGLTEDPMPSSLEPEPEFTTDETSPAYSEIAKATATATKAAAVAAKAAAEVVRLTQGIRLTEIELSREDRAAIRIQAAFRGHLPFGQVPVLQDGALTLFESRAIVRYIAEKYAAQGTIVLLGKSLAERAVIEQWMEVESQTYNPPSSFLVFQLAFAPLWGIPQNQTEIAKNEKKFSNALDVYEKRLSESKYLAGDEFSIADLSHLPNTEYIVKATGKAELITSRKYVNAWWENISSRDSWKKIREMSKADSKK